MMGGYGNRLKSKKSKFSNNITATVEYYKKVTALNGTKCIKFPEAWLGHMRSRDFLGRIGPSSKILNRLARWPCTKITRKIKEMSSIALFYFSNVLPKSATGRTSHCQEFSCTRFVFKHCPHIRDRPKSFSTNEVFEDCFTVGNSRTDL